MEFFLRFAESKFKKNINYTSYDCAVELFKYITPYWEKFD